MYGRTAYDPKDVTCGKDGRLYVMHTVDLYTAASYYLMPKLCSTITSDFSGMLDTVQGGLTYNPEIGEIVEYVYDAHADTATDLRKPVLTLIAKHVEEWKESVEFRQLLIDLPDLAFELIVELAAQKDGSPVRKGAASAAGKRKREDTKDGGKCGADGGMTRGG
jgi:hypothetical protein